MNDGPTMQRATACMLGCYDAEPSVNTSKQMSQMRTGLVMVYLMIGMSFSEHLAHRIRPQCRLDAQSHTFMHINSSYGCRSTCDQSTGDLQPLARYQWNVLSSHNRVVDNIKEKTLSTAYQWCLRVFMPNRTPHSRHVSPSHHGGSFTNMSSITRHI